jgi:arylsulfatase A-like enzyme
MKFGRKQRFFVGVSNGLAVWTWYAAVEFLFSTLAPLIVKKHEVMTAAQWGGTALILGCYIAVGALLGVVSALVLRGEEYREFRTRKLALLGLVSMFAINLAASRLDPVVKAASLTAALLIGAAIVRNVWTGPKDGRLPGDAAWVSGMLIVTAWLAQTLSSRIPRPALLAFVAGTAAVLIGIAWLARRAMLRMDSRWAEPSTLKLAMKAAGAIGLIFCSGLISSRAEIAPPPWPQSNAPEGRPNIILVTLDTVRADHMGLYGYGRQNTPNLQALAKESVLYENFIAAAPVTLSSHASIFTGLYPQSHGAYTVYPTYPLGRPLPEGIPTMASMLSAGGYRTMAVAANRYYLRPEWGTTHGFQYAYLADPVLIVSPSREYLLRNPMRRILTMEGAPQALDARTITAEDVNSHAYRLLDATGGDGAPFFLFLNYTDAHAPYLPPPPFDSMYPGRNPGFTGSDYVHLTEDVNNGAVELDVASRNHLISQYDGAIAYLDCKLGELIAYLKRKGLYNRTLIAITSDHGEAFGARKLIGHDVSVYQNQIQVPLLIKYPGQTEPRRVDALASQVDLLPTVLEAARLTIPSTLEGVSLTRAEAMKDRRVVAEYHNSALNATPRFMHDSYALFFGPWKMIYSTSGKRELYNLAADPAEQKNLYEPGSKTAAAMKEELKAWSRNVAPRYLNAAPAAEESAKQLESLGYAR